MQGIFHSISLIQNFVKGLEMVRNIKGWGHICDFRAKHINVLKSINLFHKIKKMKPNSYGILHVVFNVKNQYCRQNS